ncbi:MAG: GLUG motif-containing protein, partial [Bacillota bacterium]
MHIQNLNLTNVDITGKTRVGGLVGAIKDAAASLVENCSVTGV